MRSMITANSSTLFHNIYPATDGTCLMAFGAGALLGLAIEHHQTFTPFPLESYTAFISP